MTKYDDEIQLKKDEQVNTKKSWWLPVGIVGIFMGGLWFILGMFIAYQLPETRSNFITIEWETESETDTAGFNVYRAASQGRQCEDIDPAEYAQVNALLINSEGGATFGARYAFRDPSVQRDVDYCYQLEDVELSGTATKHAPIVGPRLRSLDRTLYMILAPLSLIGGGVAVIGGAYLLYKSSR